MPNTKLIIGNQLKQSEINNLYISRILFEYPHTIIKN